MRQLRDRLGEAMRLAAYSGSKISGPKIPAWVDERPKAEAYREHWRSEADRLLGVVGRCGLAVIERTITDDT